MPLWKRNLLNIYYHATLPMRAVRNRARAARGTAPIMVLIYHRIAHDWANGWTTHVKTFERQIHWLRRHFEMVSLEEAQRRIRGKQNHKPCVSITFDDGYAVNCQMALPLLIKLGIPVTYFVTSNCVLGGAPFEHDLKMGNRFEPNTLEQLKAMAAAGIEIGAHTRTHADLGGITNRDALYDELVLSAEDLQRALGRSIRYFAFPFGMHANLNTQAFHMAGEAGFEAVCSAYGGYNFCGDDPFHLQRIGVDGPMIRMKNWTTLDPVKQLKIHRYQYGTTPFSREGILQSQP
jgi:peptidoglycan/xylan/chitin deacetylase (PgdA/CDA1 family)